MSKSKTTKSKAAKPTKTKRSRRPRGDGRLSVLDAAAQVLKDSGGPMNCTQMVEAMLAKKIWSTKGRTPAATLSSAIQREVKTRGKESRFTKTGRGMFALA